MAKGGTVEIVWSHADTQTLSCRWTKRRSWIFRVLKLRQISSQQLAAYLSQVELLPAAFHKHGPSFCFEVKVTHLYKRRTVKDVWMCEQTEAQRGFNQEEAAAAGVLNVKL